MVLDGVILSPGEHQVISGDILDPHNLGVGNATGFKWMEIREAVPTSYNAQMALPPQRVMCP